MNKAKRHARQVAIAITGTLVLLVGIIAIPYPGPGWLIVFAGLAILATEFTWAQRVLEYAKERYGHWTAWLKSQSPIVRTAILAGTGGVIVLTLWLMNAFGLVNVWLHLPFDWIKSPLF